MYSFNLGQDKAWAVLDDMHAELPEYDPAAYASYYSRSYYNIYYEATPAPGSR